MACFITPLVAGLAVVALKRALKRPQWRAELSALAHILLGGAAVLAAEHAWHGEITPVPPFLTALQSPALAATTLLHEVGVVGTSMVAAAMALWAGIVYLPRALSVMKAGAPIAHTGRLGGGGQ